MLECEAINMPRLNILIDLHYSDAGEPRQVSCYFRFLKGTIGISYSHCAIILMGQNWAIINCSISAHYGYFKSLPIFLNTHKNNYNMYFSPATRCR